MSGSRRSQKGEKTDHSLLERLKQENRKLKRENARMRNVLARVDLSKYEHLKELVEQQRQESKAQEKAEEKKASTWNCFDCGEGHLQLMIFERRDGVFYYRLCTNFECKKKTPLKKYTKDVKDS